MCLCRMTLCGGPHTVQLSTKSTYVLIIHSSPPEILAEARSGGCDQQTIVTAPPFLELCMLIDIDAECIVHDKLGTRDVR